MMPQRFRYHVGLDLSRMATGIQRTFRVYQIAVIYYGTKRYIGEDLGLAQTCEFFKRGQPPGAAFGELHIDLTSKFKYPELYNGLDARSSDVGVWILAPRVAPTQVNFL